MKSTGFGRWAALMAFLFLGAAGEAPSKMGEVTIDARARAISFPAEVNMRTGAIEYLIVHETGKIHESIFKTAVPPKSIHVAALLFVSTNKPSLTVKKIEAWWSEEGKEKRVDGAGLILDKAKKRALAKTKWAYRGSRMVESGFLAEREGSIIAVREDRDALIDQDTPDAADDENWEPLTEVVPPIGTKVTVGIWFEEPPKSQ